MHSCSLDPSRVVSLLSDWLIEVRINISWKGSILESICVLIIDGQRVDFSFIHLTIDEVMEGTVLLPGFAFSPVFNLGEAHSGSKIL